MGEALPRSLPEALDALERDEVLLGALGPELVRVFGALKRADCEAYAGAVTDWEWAQHAFHA
jgi:glutamine synthetase